ncbi:MAG: HTTM domain-containing protein, partial [Myxococcales bacterium]|nr:HTTM domain-containing protein [Myxococcales bacterium]
MSRLWSMIDRLLGRAMLDEEEPEALGLCRIALVTVMTASLLTHVGAVSDYFSSHAVLGGEVAREAFHSRWSIFFVVQEPWAVRSVFAVGVLAHLLWLVGLYTRVAAVVAWLVWISMVGRQPLLYALPDQLHTAVATVLMLLPAGRGLSLDARWRGKRRPVPVWCRRLVQLQVATVYVATGALKTGKTWHEEGTALYYTLANPYNRHFVMDEVLVALQPWVLRPLTWAVLVWEVGFGGFVVLHWLREMLGRPRRFPDLRKPFLGFGVLMHLGIQAMLYV